MKNFLYLAGGCLLIVALFVGGEYAQRIVYYQDGWGKMAPFAAAKHMGINLFHKVPHPIDDGRLEKSGLPVYQLQIQPKELHKLRRTADQVVAAKNSTQIPRDYVPAKFRIPDGGGVDAGQWVDIEVKLRGKTHAHYNRYRPSMRFKFPKNHLFQGKREINLCRASDKGVTMDLTTNWEMSRYGIVTCQSQFVVLKLNGDCVGVYQEIEQCGRAMLDRSRRSEGYIFSGSGQLYGTPGGFAWDKAQPAIQWFLACKDQVDFPPDAGSCTWERIEEYLDTDKFAWIAAHATLLGSSHAWSLDNTRVYYDPARGKFEPIPWDFKCYVINPETSPEGETCKFYGTALLRIPEFRRMRDQRLWTLMTNRVDPMLEYADKLFAQLEEPFRFDHRSPKFWREREIHESFRTRMVGNSELLKALFEQAHLQAVGCRVYPDRFVVELTNRGKAYVVVSGVVLQRNEQRIEVDLQEPQVVSGVWRGEPGRAQLDLSRHVSDPITLADNVRLVGVVARNAITGSALADNEIHLGSQALFTATLSKSSESPSLRLARKLPEGVRRLGDEIVFGPEPVHLQSTWEIPRRYSVKFQPGLRLTLADGASLIVYGDLTSEGTSEQPVIVQGAASKHGWGALAVQGTRMAPRQVRMEHTTILGGSGAQNSRSHFTGAFSVTDGIVTLRHCRFVDGGAIDGMNLKYCRVYLRGNLVRGSADDAVDLDFCTGKVIGNRVEDSGGDGLDFSGSNLDVEQNVMERCADKGMSVGEGTTARIKNNIILHCRTGIASKDESAVTIEATGMAHLEVGIALYRKKLTFGYSSATVKGLVMADVDTALLQRPGSTLRISDSVRFIAGDGNIDVSGSVPASTTDGLIYRRTPLGVGRELSPEELKSLLLRETPGDQRGAQ